MKPASLVNIFFTDIEGSTWLARRFRNRFPLLGKTSCYNAQGNQIK